MLRLKLLLVACVFVLLACNLLTQPFQAPSVPPAEVVDTDTAVAPPVASPSPIGADSPNAAPTKKTPATKTTPLTARDATMTAKALGAAATLSAQETSASASLVPQLQGFTTSQLSQCQNPSDPPKSDWLGIPVMPQATAGKTVDTLVGSYYCFSAAVSIKDVVDFYQGKLQAPSWMLMTNTNGAMQYIGMSEAGMQLLFVVFEPGKNNDVLVGINVTRSMPIPATLKP